ncbi:MAG: protein phosphatase 2C domain-containing protein [Pseudomonadota bacterium]
MAIERLFEGPASAAAQSLGDRAEQQDHAGMVALRSSDEDQMTLYVLADGMGGHAAGAQAGRRVVQSMLTTVNAEPSDSMGGRLRAGLEAAGTALRDFVADNPDAEGMGATLVAAVVDAHALQWLSVGDSGLYLLREGHLERLNADHSMAPVYETMRREGKISDEEFATAPNKHMLRSAVTGDPVELIDCPQAPVALRPGDRLLIASDGLDTLAQDDVIRLLSRGTPGEAVDALIKAVAEVGKPRQDNTTVCVIDGPLGTAHNSKPTFGRRLRRLFGM